MLDELNDAIIAKDVKNAHIKLDELSIQKSKLESSKAKRSKTKAAKYSTITEEEVERLIEEYYEADIDELYEEFVKKTKSLWKTLSEEEKIVLTKYTETYTYLNERLRGQTYLGGRSLSEFKNDLSILTDILNRASIHRNIIVRRGVTNFNIPEISKRLDELTVGDEFTEGGFLSTGLHRNKGFHPEYEFRIIIPKGSKGIFAEPFSHYNDENEKYTFEGTLWNGIDKQEYGHEFEWIGQRGSRFRVVRVEGKTIYLEMISQLNEVIDLDSIVR